MASLSDRRFFLHTSAVLGCGVVLGLLFGLMAGRNGMKSRARLSMEGRDTIRVAMCFALNQADRHGYAAGYEYALLQRFGEDEGVEVEVVPFFSDSVDYWQQLADCDLDLLVLDAADSAAFEKEGRIKLCLRSGNCRWVVRKHDRRLLVNLNHWLGVFMEKKEYSIMESVYLSPCRIGNPKDTTDCKASRFRRISPYDDLIRQNARILGWDWRMLASLMCQESRFVMFTVSPSMAVGLMQVRPVTADYYGVPLSFDPLSNIHLGTLHLSHLQHEFQLSQFSDEDVLRLTLAAYNCGYGRVQRCIKYANEHELDGSRWEDVRTAILMMGEEGRLNGQQTVSLVDDVLARYEVYRATVIE